MGFRDECRQWGIEVDAAHRAQIVETGVLALESIVEGSALTGAPGQKVDTGALKASWIQEITEDGVRISTNIAYAPIIEEDIRSSYDREGEQPSRPKGATGGHRPHVKSTVGGPHSVALTVAGIDRLLDEAGRRVGGVIE
jgi:hypothetical protein